MKLTRTIALIAGMTLLLAACDKDETVVAIKENSNPLLAYVPADTPYVAAALEPIPKDIVDAYLARFQPVLDVMSEQIATFEADYESGIYADNQMATLASAVLEELGGNITPDNLENIGISIQSHHAVYGMGIFPVIRLGLSDAEALRDAIARIEAKMGYEMPQKDFNGKSYWRVAEDDMPVGVYITIVDQQLAISVFPVSAENDLLASFMGEQMPAQSMASANTLAIMNSKKGYSAYGSGIADLQKLAEEMLNADSKTRSYLSPEINAYASSYDEVCVAEAKAMIANTPRMTMGITQLTEDEFASRFELEIENTLATGLAALVSNTPVAEDGNHLLSGSLALQIGKLRNFVLEKANAIVTTPYECAQLQQLNMGAANLVQQLNIPMPPMINNLMGARARIVDFDPFASTPQGNGLLAVHVDKPEMFVGMATMMVPGFDALDLANQTEPVKVPPEMLQMQTQDFDLYALMTDSALGASIGSQGASELKAFMTAKTQDGGTFFSVSYDLAKQVEIQQAMSEQLGMDSNGDYAELNEFSEAMRESYTNLLGFSRIDMRFNGEGLTIDSHMTFK